MPRETLLSTNARQFILEAAREGLRLDGRGLHDFRDVEITFEEAYGAVNVRLGKTQVAARISASVTVPFADRKFEGLFNISTEFSPMVSPAFEIGRASAAETLLSRVLEKTIRRSSALDTESLCIIAGSKCFAIRADVHVLAHDGNLLDAACLALMTALQNFRRPEVSVEGEKVTVWDIREREPVKLNLMHYPLCITFSYLADGEVVLLDANAAEEKLRDGELIVSANKHGEICQIAKYGGVTEDAIEMLKWIKLAVQKIGALSALMQKRLAEDDNARNVGGLIAELSAENER